MSVSFCAYGLAKPAGSKTVGHTKTGAHFVRDSSGARGKDWRRNVAQAAGIAMQNRALLDGPVRLQITFYVPRPKAHFGAKGLKPSAPEYPTVRPDITKLLRAVEDACTGILWRDDSQIVSQHAFKRYGEPARCLVYAEAVAPVEAEEAA